MKKHRNSYRFSNTHLFYNFENFVKEEMLIWEN